MRALWIMGVGVALALSGCSSDEYRPTVDQQADYLNALSLLDPIWSMALQGEHADVEAMLIDAGIEVCTWFSKGGSADGFMSETARQGAQADASIVTAAGSAMCPDESVGAFD
ncbi:DUF732 domain-containing protein [Jiangella sp. DSM 45060]|uniref:DUF732 domain-containing protein n=1 Tax=Jiangella sp. DSM 45060 TaxID=1798224 RepID=UPI000879FA87|nr:DUF732 domain-containing protein [Jiangella sp. DSM 45060]SDT35848.1 hypothetical protein SAMN04515669_3701 [Jiangella sp. DSM 45060]